VIGRIFTSLPLFVKIREKRWGVKSRETRDNSYYAIFYLFKNFCQPPQKKTGNLVAYPERVI